MTSMSPVQEFLANQRQADKRRRWLHKLLYLAVSIFFKVEVTGLDKIPESGATVLMMNHMQFMDPVVTTAVVEDRFVISMAKAETMDHFISRFFVRLWGNFPIRRGEVDRAALNNTIELLKSEQLVLIAPEGTRNPDGLIQAKDGIAYIVHKADAIIVPTAVVGLDNWKRRLLTLRRGYAHVSFGRPFKFRLPSDKRLSKDVRQAMMREAMFQLALTIPDSYAHKRGFYSDVENATTHYLQFCD